MTEAGPLSALGTDVPTASTSDPGCICRSVRHEHPKDHNADCRGVVALTEATAAIQNATGAITVYRRHNKPALGPLGDSLDDFQ